MAQTQKRAAPARAALLHIPVQLPSREANNTAPDLSRQGVPAAWIVRRVPVSLAAARVYAELHGIGAAL